MTKTVHRKSHRNSGARSPRSQRERVTRDPKRDPSTGQFGPGNSIARKADGVNRFQKTGELPADIRTLVETFSAALLSDQGGEADLTAIRGGYVRRLRDVEAVLQLLAADLRTVGLFTDKGNVRATLQTFLQALDRWDRLAQRLGLERRSKRVESLEDFIAQRQENTHDSDRS